MTDQNSTRKGNGYIDVDSLQRELTTQGNLVERIADFYGVETGALHQATDETRMACQLTCGKTAATGDRAISVKTCGEAVLWRCFNYGCSVRGNILTLMYWMKHDQAPTGDRLQGREFKEIALDLQALVQGELCSEDTQSSNTSDRGKKLEKEPDDESPLVNVLLKDSDNERARELVNLDDRFIADVAQMSPKAAAYVRKRPFMTPAIMQKFRCGYLPSNAKGLLRGHFVYGYPDADGEILTWFGRNLNYEEQFKKWQRSGDSSREPAKFKFVKGFHRGQELYGLPQFDELSTPEKIQQTGIVLVEGQNDVINLHSLGVPALAVCSNLVTETQADKLATMANSVPGGHVRVMFDLDAEGENGAKQTVLELAKCCQVKLAWTSDLLDGQIRNRQPEFVTADDWDAMLHPTLRLVS